MGAKQSKVKPSKFHPNQCTTDKKVIGDYYCHEYKRRYQEDICTYRNYKMDCKLVSPCSYNHDDHSEVRFYKTTCAFRTKPPYALPDCLRLNTNWNEYKKLCFCKINTFIPSRKKLNCVCFNGYENIDERLVLLETYTKVCTCPRILYIGCVNRKYLKSEEQSTYPEKFDYVCDEDYEGYPIAFNSDLFCVSDDMPRLLPQKQGPLDHKYFNNSIYGNGSNIYNGDIYNNTMNVTNMENGTTTEVTTLSSLTNHSVNSKTYTIKVNKTMNYSDDNLLIFKSFLIDDTPTLNKTFNSNLVYSIPGIILFLAFLYITRRFMKRKSASRKHTNSKMLYVTHKDNDENNLIDISNVLVNEKAPGHENDEYENPAFVE